MWRFLFFKVRWGRKGPRSPERSRRPSLCLVEQPFKNAK